MSISTIIFIFFAVIIAGLLTFYQYFYKNNPNKINKFLAFLRFLSIFGLLLLLINPVISYKNHEIQKPYLPLVLDNSASIKELNSNDIALKSYEKIKNNIQLQEKFEIIPFTFDKDLNFDDSITFKGSQTKIDEVAKYLKANYKTSKYPIILLSDGNQTLGNDFLYSFEEKNPVFPIILGDTTTVLDLKIGQINANKYAFLKNKFPIEVFVNYSGNKSLKANFSILNGNNVLYKESIDFSKNNSAKIVNAMISADKIGIQNLKVSISSPEFEKNKYNNTKNFAIEVIDQRTEIALVSEINHPDLGTIKRALEHNNQRKITYIKPSETNLDTYNLFVFYQPTGSFKSIFDYVKKSGLNKLIITGLYTDFNFLTQNQDDFEFKMTTQKEEYLSQYNNQFSSFAVENLNFESFPPLENPYGTIKPKSNIQVLLESKIDNLATKQPLLCFTEKNNQRNAYLFGQNFWKWRMKSFTNEDSFEKFDIFTDKVIQFLSSKNNKKKLIVSHQNFYNSDDAIEINAQFFNKNYEFDEKAKLLLTIINQKTKKSQNYEMNKADNSFKSNLENLNSGIYNIVVTEKNTNTVYKSVFEVIAFDVEKQFVNPNYIKLNQLSLETHGKLFFPTETDELINLLLKDKQYNSIRKEIIKNSPIIDWKILLFIIILTLTVEWFLRKYNGMI
ncbi:MAG: hypothetical protein ACOVQ2_05530 [Flavobacterium sp.]